MIGSAKTARFSGRTVTHPAETPSNTASAATARTLALPPQIPAADAKTAAVALGRRRMLEVDTESSFVDLCIAIRVFGEDGQVAGFEPNQNAKAQSQEKAAAGARRPYRLLAKDE